MCVVLPQDRQYGSESHIPRRGLIKTISKKIRDGTGACPNLTQSYASKTHHIELFC